MTKPLSHLTPKFKLGKGRAPEIESDPKPSISLAFLNDIINRRVTHESHPEQVNQRVFHLALAYGEVDGLRRRLVRLEGITEGKLRNKLLKLRKKMDSVQRDFPLKVIS